MGVPLVSTMAPCNDYRSRATVSASRARLPCMLGDGIIMHLVRYVLIPAALAALAWSVGGCDGGPDAGEGDAPAASAPASAGHTYTGSRGCRQCHEAFYELWATSHHGLAMQPYSDEFAAKELSPQHQAITVGDVAYRAEIGPREGQVRARRPDGESTYPIEHVLGGKNVYYFLTPMDRGRLQTLPVAYDVRRREWYDTAASGVRHFHDGTPDEAVHWTDPLYTFNTACYRCHISQLSTNYDPASDTYDTEWGEPGINCETCHGPGAEHVRLCRAAPEGRPPEDLKIIRVSGFTPDQHNATCAPCHAKMVPLTNTFRPGDRYFDHYDLATLEDPDFHPDGRDLGENYTFTLWRMNPCAKAGRLHCVHCHTSSGRYRFADAAKANGACLPCHRERVQDAAAHHHHPAGGPGSRCIDCHMPMTTFAQMRRSDHSFLPPTPAATIRFKSPNACNLCHDDETAEWADEVVRKWHARDYQAPVLRRAGLVADARKREWARLPEMLAYITSEDRDEVTAAGLIRLLAWCDDGRKWPALVEAMAAPSPLVRAAAASTVTGDPGPAARRALLDATGDAVRLVRVRAAASLAAYPRSALAEADRTRLERASAELEASLACRPDQWTAHYNLGNYHADRGRPGRALEAFRRASQLRPDAVPPYVNASILHAQRGETDAAEDALRRALEADPASAAANLNLGLLLAETGRKAEAERHLRMAFKADPTLARAAYNLSVLAGADRLDEAVAWSRRAVDLEPANPRYVYTLAFFLSQARRADEAVTVLADAVRRRLAYPPLYDLLGRLYEDGGKRDAARRVYEQAATEVRLPPAARAQFALRLEQLAEQ